ncbi:conserved Plasmodium protein, unknown function [Plasmodium vivax]|uniref:Uncharacterized protein n=6 Tax=Plasmodium vivax TaxID=5855 RepID=A5KBA3_PLAVS|nr:hypothetical protein, conserved [Plasmodium vivax]KMZ80705.1 hypothetical protein PVIIG_03072 [Plasmodium vivax India VII]KMZ86781.1 hypothetical protein PVBG_04439 [Plasmodium vivax Brazil I]KMZ93609.1 hypothetical protein PVMG_01055 [Plasmodium vivax Mauritania I]KMZ99897.1 hypothetical protein PVNG_05419 [Plasmodium vivax North Korean]EDL43381.1 hypothetical protein, conserved [Plasmodium vivax]|eukprot:XP_001613108.1 hypothetical protein [Plasmodium vivax Sal-1]
MNAVGLLIGAAARSCCWAAPPGQRRHKSHLNSVSILQQFYNRLPIRKRYIKAIKKGTLVWDKGQVKIPPLKIEGYDPPKKCLSPLVKNRNNQYRGSFLNLRAHRVEFQD